MIPHVDRNMKYGIIHENFKGRKNMWTEKQRKFQKSVCSKLVVAILLFTSIITFTACESSDVKETTQQTNNKKKKWEPLTISKQEKAQAQKEVKEILDICQNIKINENKVTKKDLQTLYETLTSKGYPVAQIGEEKHSTKNAPVKFKPSKTSHGEKLKAFYKKTKAGKPAMITLLQQNSSGGFANIRLQSSNGKAKGILTTIYKEDGRFSISEMVKYQVKKLELNEKNIMILEFYLSDQAELQTDGTMQFQL